MAPYAVGLVELDEALRITARVAGGPEHLSNTVDAARGPIFDPADPSGPLILLRRWRT